MRDAVVALGLEVRIGVNTGEVVAGTGETLATGDAVNVAARLEQAADTGEILIGAATERLVRDRVRTEPVAALALKGKAEPVSAFRVLELLDDVPAFTRPIAAPFVGREEELALLEGTLASAAEGGTPQLATIVGPPGIGKSRLARELLGRAEARIVVGRCLPYGEGITYWPLQEIAAQLGDVHALLHEAGDAELAAVRVDAALGSTDTPVSPEEIAWGVRKLFEALAAAAPLIVVFDDIHWAEPAFLDLVEYVATFAQDVPLFVLCTARPELFELRPAWPTPKPNATVLTLEPLSLTDSESLVTELSDVGADAKTRIVEAAEGNPLFVEQLVVMQAESGNGELEVPPTLQALLAARIDRLAEPERAVVERGAVEGRLFHRGAVAALLPEQERAALGSHLLTLVRKQLIRPDHSTLPGDDGFRFGHILIREAAYEAIPKRQRATLHARFADWLADRLGADAPDEIVGYHLEQAYRYGAELGAPDSTLGERAAERLATAADAARMRDDARAEVNLLGRAVELVPDGAARPALLANLGAALREAGELTGAQAVLEEGAALARNAGDEHVEWLARVTLADVLGLLEPERGAEQMLREGQAAIAAREGAADHEVLARAWRLVASSASTRMSDYPGALDTALTHARLAGDPRLEAQLVLSKAPYFIWGPGLVVDGLRQAEDAVRSLGHIPGVQAYALHVRAHMQARLGEFDGAFDAVSEFRRLTRELGRETLYAITSGCVWDVCLWAGEWERGEEALRESYEALERMGNKGLLASTALDLGDAVLRQGRVDEAEELSVIGEEHTANEDAWGQARCLTLRAKVQGVRGDRAGAEELARRAIELAAADEFPELAADARLVLGEAVGSAGDAEARALGAEALELYERKGNLVGASWARAYLESART
jgi:tetratricopeptide (TPR) repeat protein